MIARRADPWVSCALLTIGVAALGHSLQLGDGTLMPGTMLWLSIALVACIAAITFPWPTFAARRVILAVAVVACLGWQVMQVWSRGPFALDAALPSDTWMRTFRIGLIAAAASALAALLGRYKLRHVAFGMLLVIHFMLGISVLRAVPAPNIDVFVFQRDSSETLTRGVNPYTLTFPDIHGSQWYGPGVSVNGRLQFGYPYLPLTLLLATPGHWLGDYRYANLAAMTLSAALIAYARPSVLSFAAAALLLLQPRGMYILQRGWSEPLVLLILAATVFCAVRLPRTMPWVLGLLLVSKQYMPFIVATSTLLLHEPVHWRQAARLFLKAALAAALVTLPLALWNFEAFWKSAVILQFSQPFRWDALSYLALWFEGRRDVAAPLWVPFAALLVATGLALWRCRHGASGFAAAVAVVLFAFFAFNKQAFANYYYLVIGAMCCAIATATPSEG